MRISLCLVVWNELEGCKIDVPRLPRHAFDEIYAVDAGSTDGTREHLASHGIPVHLQPKKGLNAAYVHANRQSTCDAVVTFFPKGTTPVEDLLKFRPLLEEGYDLIIASRQIAGSANEEDAHLWRPRKWGVRALAVIAGTLWRREGPLVLDVLHGFKGWKRDAFERMRILETGLSIDLEMVSRSYKLRMKRIEFPTTETPRLYGDSHFKVLPTAKRLSNYLLFELRRND
jgi:glycosyltransferase involved in cell wall biosynthesis